MPILILSLSLLFVRVNGSLTGVELRVAPGPQLRCIGVPADVERRGDTIDVRLGSVINPMGLLGKPIVSVIFPESASIDVKLSLSLSKAVLDLSTAGSAGLDIELKFSNCEIVLPSSTHRRTEIYSLMSDFVLSNAQAMLKGGVFNMKGGRAFIEARKRIPAPLYFFADGAKIIFSVPASVWLDDRGVLNIKKLRKPTGGRPGVRAILSGSFNVVRDRY